MNGLFEKGLTKSYEIGPGKVIAGIAKRINKAHDIVNVVA
jgi:[acyl-carrier-protein] S-malonyltransferase